MMPTPNFGLPLYGPTDTAKLDTLLNGQSSAIDTGLRAALDSEINYRVGTTAEREAFTGREGLLWYDTGDSIVYRYSAGLWLPTAYNTPWERPTLAAGWGGYAGEYPFYQVRQGICFLGGRTTGQAAAGATIFTLPPEARHTAPFALVFKTHSDNIGDPIMLVGADGAVVCASGGGSLRQGVSLAGISFPVG